MVVVVVVAVVELFPSSFFTLPPCSLGGGLGSGGGNVPELLAFKALPPLTTGELLLPLSPLLPLPLPLFPMLLLPPVPPLDPVDAAGMDVELPINITLANPELDVPPHISNG